MKKSCFLILLVPFGLMADSPQVRAKTVLDNQDISFEPDTASHSFRSWSPDYRLTVASSGYDLYLRDVKDANPPRRVQMTIADARDNGLGQADREIATNRNYIRGKSFRQVRQAYRRIRYADTLPGVDVVYHGKRRHLEFDFVVNPGADPRGIRLRFQGQDSLDIDADGNLIMQAGDSRVIQQTPAVYQEVEGGLRLVSGSYVLASNNEVGFSLGRYDRTRPLIIDPVVSYVGFAGGSRVDNGLTAVFSNGFLYIAGTTWSTDYPLVGSPVQTEGQGDADVFVTKIDPNVPADIAIVYSTFIGGTGRDELKSMVIGPDNALLLAGVTESTDFPVSAARQATAGGETDAFIVKLAPSLEGTAGLVYSTYLGSGSADSAQAIAVDSQGNAYVTGIMYSNDLALVGSSLPSYTGNGGDAFLARFDIAGTLTYFSYFGGDAAETARAVAVDSAGAVYIGGWTMSEFLPIAGSYQPTAAGRGDVFLAKLNRTDSGYSLGWSTYLGGSDFEDLKAISALPGGRVVLTGVTLSSDFPIAGNALQRSYGGDADLFITVFDPTAEQSGALVYSSYFGGNGGDVPYDLKVGAGGRITVAGYTLSTNFPTTADALQRSYQGGGADGFVSTLDLSAEPQNAVVYSTYIGGADADAIYGIGTDANGAMCLGGVTYSPTFLAGTPAQAARGSRNGDAFLVVLR